MSSETTEKVLALLQRVLNDALIHKCEAVVVRDTPSGVRFESELGATLAFLPADQVIWVDVAGVLRRLMDDAEKRGYRHCVVEDDVASRITLYLADNASYFGRNANAIIRRLRG